MPYTVLVRFDSAGACPVIAENHPDLHSGGGVRWRYIAQVAEAADAARLVDNVRDQIDAGEIGQL
jgi:hypothetical protein